MKSEEVIQSIEYYLKLTWSPEQISNTVLKGVISFKTIDVGCMIERLSCLRQKEKRQKSRETRGRFNIGTSIHKRPKELKNVKRLDMGPLPLTKSMSPPLVGNGSPGSAKHYPPLLGNGSPAIDKVDVSSAGRESSYFMRNCRICIDNSS